MKISFKAKNIIKKVALALAGVAALTAVGFGVKAIVDFTKNDLKTVNLSYDIGNLGADGKFVDNKGTLYTKDAFACYGLQVKPDFDSTVNYQIFYYDILDNYISSTSVLSDGYSDEAPINGAYARIVIEPRNDEDGKISLTERVKYPSQLTVKTKKAQDINNRFCILGGKIMQVVYNESDLIFDGGIDLGVSSDFEWKEYKYNCATTSTFLSVSGGSTLTYNYSSLGETFEKSFVRLFEFTDIPSVGSLLTVSSVESGDKFVLDKKTKFLVFVVTTNDAQVFWTEESLSKLPLCFSVTKTK